MKLILLILSILFKKKKFAFLAIGIIILCYGLFRRKK